MKKRILCVLLAVLICLGTSGCLKTEESVLTVAVESINGDFYPFTSSGDSTLKDMIFTKLVDFDQKGELFLGKESSAVSEKLRVFYADGNFAETDTYTEGGHTAFEMTLKSEIVFSDGTPLTAKDVLFSLYCAVDPEAGYINSDTLPIAGLDNYIYQSADAADLLSIAEKILSKGKGYVPTQEDPFTEEESRIYWDSFSAAGEKFTSNIVSYVNENYCTDELVSSYVFDGYTGDSIKNSTALSNTYAMRLWNYGNYTYSYVPDENGIFVGVGDENGVYTYKTTLEKALESEEYVQYVLDENGAYVYDKVSAKYREYAEGDVGKRYSRVLSDKYTVLSKNSLTGFRDMAGKLYTLEGEDYPSLSEFFSLMCIAYTENGIIDHRRMESVEAAKEGDSFTKEAAETFASSLAGTHAVDSVEGIKYTPSEDGAGEEKITVYIEGNLWDRIYLLSIPVVPMAYCTEGYTYEEGDVVNSGVPLSSDSFVQHLKERSSNPVGAGAYTLHEISENGEFALFKANIIFNSVSEENISSSRFENIKFISTDKSAADVMKTGDADICLIPLDESESETLGENVKTYFTPAFSYDYVVVNPVSYININVRRALFSLMDTSVATGGYSYREIASSMPSFMWVSDASEKTSVYDETGESAKKYFEAAGYTISETGELVDPATKQKAEFKFTLLPSAKGGRVESMFIKTAELLKGLGADAKIVYDADLMMNIYSRDGVGIYSLGWETDMGGSLYMRYALGSGSDSVKANGITALSEGGQIDNFGTVTFTDNEGGIIEYNQSLAVSTLDALIVRGDESIVFEDKKTAYSKALSLLFELSFELPLCQRGNLYCVDSSRVDVASLNEDPTVFESLISRPWKLSPVAAETE